jgi:hypothetical protein
VYRDTRRKELVDLKIETFTKEYDERLGENLKKYMEIYTPLVAQIKPDFIKEFKNAVKDIG